MREREQTDLAIAMLILCACSYDTLGEAERQQTRDAPATRGEEAGPPANPVAAHVDTQDVTPTEPTPETDDTLPLEAATVEGGDVSEDDEDDPSDMDVGEADTNTNDPIWDDTVASTDVSTTPDVNDAPETSDETDAANDAVADNGTGNGVENDVEAPEPAVVDAQGPVEPLGDAPATSECLPGISGIYGDVDGDGLASVVDVQCIIRTALSNDPAALPVCALFPPSTDLDCDFETNIVDAGLAIRLSVGAGLDASIDVNQNGIHDACDACYDASGWFGNLQATATGTENTDAY